MSVLGNVGDQEAVPAWKRCVSHSRASFKETGRQTDECISCDICSEICKYIFARIHEK